MDKTQNTNAAFENMGDHRITVDCLEQLLTTPTPESLTTRRHIAIPVDEISAAMEAANAKGKSSATSSHVKDKPEKPEDDAALTADKAECRFCQDEDFVTKLEAPCHCNGTLKFAHRSCIQRWCNAKGDTICEICHQPYHPNYAVTERPSSDSAIGTSEGWRIPGTNTQIQSPLLLAEIATDRVSAALNDDCNLRNPSGGVICGTGLLLFLTLLILRDAYYYTPPKEDKLFHVIYCVLVVILAPFYIMSWFYECRALRDNHRERGRGRERERDRTA